MTRINLFILLTIAANTCGAITPKNTKTNPAAAIVALKLQAKPIVFFNTEELHAERDYQTGYLIRSSKSDEMNDIEKARYQHSLSEQASRKALEDKMNAGRLQLNNKQITQEAWDKEYKRLCDESTKMSHESCEKTNALSRQEQAVPKKIAEICGKVSKRLGACAFFYYNPNAEAWYFAMCVDPEYDITQEVLDTLNKEYNESKSQKNLCNNSCCDHCPLKNTQH